MSRFQKCLSVTLLSSALLATIAPVTAQTTSPPAQAETPANYVFPELPPNVTTFNNKLLSVRIGFIVLADYTFVRQNSSSIEQVGPQASQGDLRAGRLAFSGQFKFKSPWTYMIAADYNELRQPEDQIFEGVDVYLTIPLWGEASVKIGKQKETFVYEMIGDAANLPQQERILSPFFVTRNIGIRYLDNYLKDRMLFSIGIFNDWFRSDRSFADSGTQVSGRLTGLPLFSTDGREFLHLGVGFRYVGADSGEMRYKGRPESNVIDYYVDTDTFPAKYAKQLGLEALYNTGPFSVLTEYAQAWVESPEKGNPGFSGSYVTGSYVLTGETRPYDKKVGYARRVIPTARWGALELVGRFGYVNLDDTLIKGGKLAKWYAGMNWWASRQWKLSMGYGLGDLDRFDTTGRTQMLFTRLQWIY